MFLRAPVTACSERLYSNTSLLKTRKASESCFSNVTGVCLVTYGNWTSPKTFSETPLDNCLWGIFFSSLIRQIFTVQGELPRGNCQLYMSTIGGCFEKAQKNKHSPEIALNNFSKFLGENLWWNPLEKNSIWVIL